jgi:hypothetical protein
MNIFFSTPNSKPKYKMSFQAHGYNSHYLGGKNQDDESSKLAKANRLQDPISKISNRKKTGRVAQVVECLSSKCEAFSSNPNATLPKKFEI